MLTAKPKVGLLPLYLKLYDDGAADRRPQMEAFCGQIAAELERRGLSVARAPVCRVAPEFDAAVRSFEEAGAEAIVTLHLAYSPSLESADALSRTKLPIVVCDTTPAWSFGSSQDPDEVMYNHGIHGVQDMCNLLIRRGKAFTIQVGHWQKSDVLDRVVRDVSAARMASRMRTMRVGIIGRPFKGMGDFAVTPGELRSRIGAEVRSLEPRKFARLLASVTEQEVQAEREIDAKRFDFGKVGPDAYMRSARTGIAVQKWVDREDLGAFTVNFLDVNRASGIPTVPFLQASKLMAAGVGYAGEGDTLTASLVASLAAVFPKTSFTEMFCPDWQGGTIYLSHMGEVNYSLVSGKPKLIEMQYKWSDAENPVFLAGRFRAGRVLFVNLAPVPSGFRLVVAPAAMVEARGKDRMEKSVHGWFKPDLDVPEFLARYSRAGGTHHLAVCYDADLGIVEAFAHLMGWETALIA
jgi:L-arabinose isomerase